MTIETVTTVDLFKPLYKSHKKYEWADAIDDPAILNTRRLFTYQGRYTINALNNVITVNELPGLKILPGFISKEEQAWLIEYTLNELVPDVAHHKSNLTPLIELPDRLDLFNDDLGPFPRKPDPSNTGTTTTSPKNVTIRAIREKHLRWITLGGQYDWTAKVYPTWERHSEGWPDFPEPLVDFISQKLHSSDISYMLPEAAIVNFYSPGDTLSAHQDVAEKSDNDLVSISIGCACIFYAGLTRYTDVDDDNDNGILAPLPLLLQSGDIIIMGGASRRAFHGVSKVFSNTCPDFDTLNPQHRDWSARKRLNINVRQMV